MNLKTSHIMAFTLNFSDFMQNFNTENLKTSIKSQITSKKNTFTTLYEFTRSAEISKHHEICSKNNSKVKKQKIITSSMLKDYSVSQDSQDDDKLLQQVKII
jgi:hypothetical protein